MTKTISIYIFLEDEPSVECITAGNSAEHNATTLKFILESQGDTRFPMGLRPRAAQRRHRQAY